MRDTIFALATAPGRAAVAIVRISGPEASAALRALGGRLPKPRQSAVRRLRSADGQTIDEALTLWMPAPASYTGEDMVELQTHGGVAVVAAVTRALEAAGLRLASPGEFTRRAFEAGRLDLDQAEGVADLIDAETEAQARQALAQLGGALGRRYEAWRETLTHALAYVEVAVDFPDEEVPADVAGRALPLVSSLQDDLTAALADSRRGERVRDGYRIALIGAPNAGKSALFNALLGRDAAIVTPTAGTTRDVIEAAIVLDGYKVILADMAGLRVADGAIEAEGVRRAQAWAEDAALRIWVVDGAACSGAWREAADLVRARDFLVFNKSDLPSGADRAAASARAGEALPVLDVTATAGDGMDRLKAGLAARVVGDLSGAGFPAVTRLRHEALLREALARLEHLDAAALEWPELAAEDLRLAARALERITGRIGADDVLDVVFGTFCIGK